ncbi:MAG: SprT-like domain-containing protein [Bdellovibrionales bacterium]|nr:SprT-like domain-containing protein [Bdellovibrionales bacterium]
MFLYSNTIKTFIARVRSDVREIVSIEMNMQMDRSRIFYNGIFYPLNIVVFEDNSRLGYFDSRTYELGLSKKLMYQAKADVLKNIIRHELAHFVAYILHGNHVMHGEEFKNICRRYGWDREVELAYGNVALENDKIEGDLKTEKLLERLKKLLALTSSDNPHERELATLKANQLLLEHNLDLTRQAGQDDETVYVKRVLEATRKQTKHVVIYEILKTFFVSPVFNHGRGVFYLEVIGDKTSVELAEYVAHFLNLELDNMWKEAKKKNPTFKNIAAKNSFLRGVSKGYVEKIEGQKKKSAQSFELALIEKNLATQLKVVYSRLGHSSMSSGTQHHGANAAGIESGKNLSIKPGISKNTGKTLLLS